MGQSYETPAQKHERVLAEERARLENEQRAKEKDLADTLARIDAHQAEFRAAQAAEAKARQDANQKEINDRYAAESAALEKRQKAHALPAYLAVGVTAEEFERMWPELWEKQRMEIAAANAAASHQGFEEYVRRL